MVPLANTGVSVPAEIVSPARSALLLSGTSATLENSEVLLTGQPLNPRKQIRPCFQSSVFCGKFVTSVTVISTCAPLASAASVVEQRLLLQPAPVRFEL